MSGAGPEQLSGHMQRENCDFKSSVFPGLLVLSPGSARRALAKGPFASPPAWLAVSARSYSSPVRRREAPVSAHRARVAGRLGSSLRLLLPVIHCQISVVLLHNRAFLHEKSKYWQAFNCGKSWLSKSKAEWFLKQPVVEKKCFYSFIFYFCTFVANFPPTMTSVQL